MIAKQNLVNFPTCMPPPPPPPVIMSWLNSKRFYIDKLLLCLLKAVIYTRVISARFKTITHAPFKGAARRKSSSTALKKHPYILCAYTWYTRLSKHTEKKLKLAFVVNWCVGDTVQWSDIVCGKKRELPFPTTKIRWPYVVLMSAHRLRRWADISTTWVNVSCLLGRTFRC